MEKKTARAGLRCKPGRGAACSVPAGTTVWGNRGRPRPLSPWKERGPPLSPRTERPLCHPGRSGAEIRGPGRISSSPISANLFCIGFAVRLFGCGLAWTRTGGFCGRFCRGSRGRVSGALKGSHGQVAGARRRCGRGTGLARLGCGGSEAPSQVVGLASGSVRGAVARARCDGLRRFRGADVRCDHGARAGPHGIVVAGSLHLRLPSLRCDFFEVTPARGSGNGERFTRFPVGAGDHILADRGYATASGLRHRQPAGGSRCG